MVIINLLKGANQMGIAPITAMELTERQSELIAHTKTPNYRRLRAEILKKHGMKEPDWDDMVEKYRDSWYGYPSIAKDIFKDLRLLALEFGTIEKPLSRNHIQTTLNNIINKDPRVKRFQNPSKKWEYILIED